MFARRSTVNLARLATRRPRVVSLRSHWSAPSLVTQLTPTRHYHWSGQQDTLPRLPVPPLQHTLERLLQSVEPLATPSEYQEVQQLAAEFGASSGVGPRLQAALQDRASKTLNWLEDWWLHLAYLEPRCPNVVHVSPAFLLSQQEFHSQQNQLEYAAKFCRGVLSYMVRLFSGDIAVDTMRGQPLCMHQYNHLFSVCRLPAPVRDHMYIANLEQAKDCTFIVVFHNNKLFRVEVIDSGGQPYSTSQICQQLQHVVQLSQHSADGVGVLTSLPRDLWSEAYQCLAEDEANKRSLDMVKKSLFVLCLDGPLHHRQSSNPLTKSINHMMHATSPQHSAANRWFDKDLQFIITEDGLCGANGDHSVADGAPLVAVLEEAIEYCKSSHEFEEHPVNNLSPVEELKFNMSDKALDYIQQANQHMDGLISEVDLKAWEFNDYGRDTVKKMHVSPYAFVQMALQLAFYSLHGRPCGTYEPASTRWFLHGRTDTIRACSNQSLAFCKAALDQNVGPEEKAKLLRQGIDRHVHLTKEALAGQGIDRHLLGMRVISRQLEKAEHPLLSHPAVQRSCHWTMSTSQYPSKVGGMFAFGPVVPDGYGIWHDITKDCIRFTISAWNTCEETNTDKMLDSIEHSLRLSMQILSSASKL